MKKLTLVAQIKKYTKKQLVSLDSEYEIVLRINNISNIELLDELSQADSNVKVVMTNEER